LGSCFCRCRKSHPSTSGIIRSSTISFGGGDSRKYSIASLPPGIPITVNPSSRRSVVNAFLEPASSSTTRICVFKSISSFPSWLPVDRQHDRKGRPLPGATGHRDFSTHRINEPPFDPQPQPNPAVLSPGHATLESCEQTFLLFR